MRKFAQRLHLRTSKLGKTFAAGAGFKFRKVSVRLFNKVTGDMVFHGTDREGFQGIAKSGIKTTTYRPKSVFFGDKSVGGVYANPVMLAFKQPRKTKWVGGDYWRVGHKIMRRSIVGVAIVSHDSLGHFDRIRKAYLRVRSK